MFIVGSYVLMKSMLVERLVGLRREAAARPVFGSVASDCDSAELVSGMGFCSGSLSKDRDLRALGINCGWPGVLIVESRPVSFVLNHRGAGQESEVRVHSHFFQDESCGDGVSNVYASDQEKLGLGNIQQRERKGRF